MKGFAGGLVWSLLIFPFAPAQAQMVIQPHTASALLSCYDDRLYKAGDAGAPPLIRDSLTTLGKPVVFRSCRDDDGNTHYFVRASYPKQNNVCRILDQEIFPGSDGDQSMIDTGPHNDLTIKGWKAWPPDDWTLMHYTRQSRALGFVTTADCPLGNDPHYIVLDHVTDGMLNAFQKAWTRVTKSPASLAKAFGAVPTASGAEGQIDAKPSQALRDRLQSRNFTFHDKPSWIDCEAKGCTAYFENLAIAFDVGPTGIVFTKLSPLWVT